MRAAGKMVVKETFTIGTVAKRAGVGIETVRFYEREGLIKEPPRRESGYREYPINAIGRIRFIKRAQELGFSLKEISELLELRLHPEKACREVKERALSKISDVEIKIKDLQRIRRALLLLTESCVSEKSLSECPILDAFESKGDYHAKR